MRTVCAWCKVVMIAGPSEPTTHGICPSCAEQWDGPQPLIASVKRAIENNAARQGVTLRF